MKSKLNKSRHKHKHSISTSILKNSSALSIRTRSSISPDKSAKKRALSSITRRSSLIRKKAVVNGDTDDFSSENDKNNDSNSEIDIDETSDVDFKIGLNEKRDNSSEEADYKEDENDSVDSDEDDVIKRPFKIAKSSVKSRYIKRRPGRPRKRSLSNLSTSSNNSLNSFVSEQTNNNDSCQIEKNENDTHKSSKNLSKPMSQPYFIEQSSKFVELNNINNMNKIFKLNKYENIDLIFKNDKVQLENDEKKTYIKQNDILERLITKQTDQYKVQQAHQLQINEKITLDLPKVNIRVLNEIEENLYLNRINYSQPDCYIKYAEKTWEEMDEEVEYDMDEEDNVWLKLINQQRLKEKIEPLQQEQFEIWMDRLEKESYFQSTSTTTACTKQKMITNINSNQTSNENLASEQQQIFSQESNKLLNESSFNEDALCCICLDGECLNSNAILFCDMCNLAVHQECYGVPYIPEGQWLCRRCIQSPSAPVDCILCPNRYGAFKQTDRSQWAHVVCSIWIPEVHFANTVFLEPIIGIENIDKARWKLMCFICRKRNVGACIQCDRQNCYTAFHVTCAQQAGLYMNIQEQATSDNLNLNRKKKGRHSEKKNDSSLAEVKKCAYCDIHTPLEVLSPATRKKLGVSVNRGVLSLNEYEEEMKRAQKMRMKRARKILAERRNAPPQICLPVIPKERIQDIQARIDIEQKEKLFERLMNYWQMKRYSRNGVPLLRRLQNNGSIKKNNKSAPKVENVNGNPVDEDEDENSLVRLKEQLSYFKKLRQDLERARLLMELIRKRERLKRDDVRCNELAIQYELNPFNGLFLKKLLNFLIDLDKHKIFISPVDVKEVPTYCDKIKEPMDFSKMLQKLNEMKYDKFEQFEYDFNLIVNNCMAFNDKKSIYFKSAFKLREQASTVLKQAKRISENNQSLLVNDSRLIMNQLIKQSNKLKNKLDSSVASTNTTVTNNSMEEETIEKKAKTNESPTMNKTISSKTVKDGASVNKSTKKTKSNLKLQTDRPSSVTRTTRSRMSIVANEISVMTISSNDLLNSQPASPATSTTSTVYSSATSNWHN